MSPALAGGLLTTAPPGKPLPLTFEGWFPHPAPVGASTLPGLQHRLQEWGRVCVQVGRKQRGWPFPCPVLSFVQECAAWTRRRAERLATTWSHSSTLPCSQACRGGPTTTPLLVTQTHRAQAPQPHASGGSPIARPRSVCPKRCSRGRGGEQCTRQQGRRGRPLHSVGQAPPEPLRNHGEGA